MVDVHERLREAAKAGSEAELKAFLRDPNFDALAKDDDDLTASRLAADRGHESLTRFIDAYARAQVERADLEAQADPGAPRGRAAPRVLGSAIIKQD